MKIKFYYKIKQESLSNLRKNFTYKISRLDFFVGEKIKLQSQCTYKAYIKANREY